MSVPVNCNFAKTSSAIFWDMWEVNSWLQLFNKDSSPPSISGLMGFDVGFCEQSPIKETTFRTCE